MKDKKRKQRLFIICILCLTILSGCVPKATYTSENLKLAFVYPSGYAVSEDESSLTFNLSEKVKVAVFSHDVSAAADERYLQIYSREELGLNSGAFETNYNNTLFVSQMFEYILSGASAEYSVYGVNKDKFGSYDAWCARFVSSDSQINGYLYLCVENLRCYIIVIYVKDADIHTDDKIINNFIESFSILKGS